MLRSNVNLSVWSQHMVSFYYLQLRCLLKLYNLSYDIKHLFFQSLFKIPEGEFDKKWESYMLYLKQFCIMLFSCNFQIFSKTLFKPKNKQALTCWLLSKGNNLSWKTCSHLIFSGITPLPYCFSVLLWCFV
jgi:glutathione peroxidase-family protein